MTELIAVGVRRLSRPYNGKLQRQDIGVVPQQVDRHPSIEGGYQLIGFLKPRLHCGCALVAGPHKYVGITILAGRRLVNLRRRLR